MGKRLGGDKFNSQRRMLSHGKVQGHYMQINHFYKLHMLASALYDNHIVVYRKYAKITRQGKESQKNGYFCVTNSEFLKCFVPFCLRVSPQLQFFRYQQNSPWYNVDHYTKKVITFRGTQISGSWRPNLHKFPEFCCAISAIKEKRSSIFPKNPKIYAKKSWQKIPSDQQNFQDWKPWE